MVRGKAVEGVEGTWKKERVERGGEIGEEDWG